MRASQDGIFEATEGDKWFERNKSCLTTVDPERDLPLKLLDLYNLRPRSVLEVGASNGFRLARISERYGAEVTALDPSAEAIADGRARFPRVRFVRGSAYAIPLSRLFDLVIVNFVFHWIDRSHLLRSVAEVDRVLMDGGFLIVGDFFPSTQTKVRYHHLPEQEVYTYKQDYAASLLASGLYRPVCLLTGGHSAERLTAEGVEDERIAVWLLRKALGDLYVVGRARR